MRVIQGPKTQLNWPGAMAVDPETQEVYVANDVGQSIIVFREADKGDARPVRVLKGSRTGLSYPTGVFVDTKNKELWAANLGNSSTTVYSLSANGNTPPLRTIRSAPKGKVSLRFGKTQAVAYDSKREQILVPN
jgi:DNA-binding beta-propeller fold protein YncE